ncbi:MAG: hypothetical protein D6743_09215 [Calditrichaeota bacterium]|nr:MAG: hypothetical protein D6743_09215 [Calditrichota bacterium]
MWYKFTLVVLLLVVFAGQDARAQGPGGKFGAGVLVGGSKLQGDIANTSTAMTGGFMLKYSPFKIFALSSAFTLAEMTSGLDAIKTRVLNSSLTGNFTLLPNNKFRPFISIGVSRFHYSTTDGRGQPVLRADGSRVAGWETALQVGIGVELFTGRQWAITTMGRYHAAQVDELDGINLGKNDRFMDGLIGLMHYFRTGRRLPSEQGPPRQWLPRPLAKPSNQSSSPSHEVSKAANDSGRFADGIYFAPNSAQLLDKSLAKLDTLFRYLTDNPDEVVELRLRSSKAQGQHAKLVRLRAEAVKAYLVNLGIAPERIVISEE